MHEFPAWALAPHCCRHCLGRIVSSGETYRCSCCGVEAANVMDGKPIAICGCGIRLGEGRLRERGLFRCAPNPARSEAAPAEIAILFGGAAPELAEGSQPRQAA